MHVLHILDHSIPLHSGYTFRTAAILREQRALGWQTSHLTSPKQINCSASIEEVDGLRFYRTWPFKPRWTYPVFREIEQMAATTRRLEELARELRPDVLHAHSPALNAIPAIRVGRKLGIPVVYEIRAFWEDAAVDHGTSREDGLRYKATRALETWVLKRADQVTCICEGLRKDIVARGIPASKVTIIPNAVDANAFNSGGPANPELATRLGINGCEVVGFIGSFYAYEGLDLLLDAFPRMLAAKPNIRLLMVGGGPQDASLKAQALRLGISDQVIFTGRVPHQDVQQYYDLIDVLAYPRHSMRLTELVTPLKPLEAMAQGRLFIASDVGGHKELIRDGETGVLFAAGSATALANAALKLLDEPQRWPLLRSAGRNFVEKERTWTNSVARYKEVYQMATGRTRIE